MSLVRDVHTRYFLCYLPSKYPHNKYCYIYRTSGDAQTVKSYSCTNMEVSPDFQQRLVGILEEAVISLCEKHFCQSAPLEVDGIVCITEQIKRVNHVVKLHTKLFNSVNKETIPNDQMIHGMEQSISVGNKNDHSSRTISKFHRTTCNIPAEDDSNTEKVNRNLKEYRSQQLSGSRVPESRHKPVELDSPPVISDHCVKAEPKSFDYVETTECRFQNIENRRGGTENNSRNNYCIDESKMESFDILKIDDRSAKDVAELEKVFTKISGGDDTQTHFESSSRNGENFPTVASISDSPIDYNPFQKNNQTGNLETRTDTQNSLIQCIVHPNKRIDHHPNHTDIISVDQSCDTWPNHSTDGQEMHVKTEEVGDGDADTMDMSLYNMSLWSQYYKPANEADIHFQPSNYFTQDTENHLEKQDGSTCQKRYACKYNCGMTFTRMWTRSRHEITRCPKAKSYTVYKCKCCGFQSRRRDDMANHIRQYHQLIQEYNQAGLVSDYILTFEKLVDE
ncbi:hypothetical protein ScPMuIL_011215 [Solemya velum]